MKVSIIVPVYNEKKTVRQILGRVFFAKLPAGMTCEVIVVNDASADGTDKQLAKIKRRFKLLTHRQ
ncbi:MAG: glycosyltransferase, partial [Patescibacteria group bacterium]